MSDFEAHMYEFAFTLPDGRTVIDVDYVKRLLARYQINGQVQTFRETRMGPDGRDEALKVILRNIALTVMLGRGGKVHKTLRRVNPGGRIETQVTVKLEVLEWDDD